MTLINFNSWSNRHFFIILCMLQASMLGLILLDLIGLNVHLLRGLIGFIYLTFLPGASFLRILNLKKSSFIEIVLYSVGLSIVFLMFIGFLLNSIGYYVISNPISIYPIFFTICFLLFVISYFFYGNSEPCFYSHNITGIKKYFIILCIALLPTLSILGTYFVNSFNSNIFLILFILLIVAIFLLVLFTQLVPPYYYPAILFAISISLLYHNSLISTYLTGWDIHQEYHFSNLVLINGHWNSTLSSHVNSVLAIVILVPIYSIITDLNITWIFKIIFPFLFSLLPVGIYAIYNEQINNERISFLATFYFVSIYTYYTEMLALARQEIAEFFLILIILSMISKEKLLIKRLFSIIFSFGLVVSHYGLSYLFVFFSLIGFIFMIIFLKRRSEMYRLSFIVLFFVLAISWYLYSTEGSTFEQMVNLLNYIRNTLFDEIFNTSSIDVAFVKSVSQSGIILRYLYLISQLFVFIGFVYVILSKNQLNFSSEFLALSAACLCLLIVSTITPFTGLNIRRLYHISSIFLSLFFIIGGAVTFNTIKNLANSYFPMNFTDAFKVKSFSLKMFSIFLILFFSLNIGLFQEIVKDNPKSISISQERIINEANDIDIKSFYGGYFPEEDIYGTVWISKKRDPYTTIYSDLTVNKLIFTSYGMMINESVLENTSKIKDEYIYLRYTNVKYKWFNGPNKYINYWNVSDFSPILSNKNIIYSNGKDIIYK